jgi:hypothetical protein
MNPDMIKLTGKEDVREFARKLSEAFTEGKEIRLGDSDVEAIVEGGSTYIHTPTNIKLRKVKGERVSVKKDGHSLSFVSDKDIIDINKLMSDIESKGEKVWFWVADQLGRGMYSDNVINGEHYLDAGPSYALDPENRSKNIIWATGKSEKEVSKLIDRSDYIFIISGSPQKSKLFNSTVIDLVSKRIGDYKSFKKSALDTSPVKDIREVLEKHDSWESLKASPDRKKFLLGLEGVKEKKSTPLKTLLEDKNAFVDLNELRDGFYADNNFDMGDVMLVLKPEGFGGKSKHSTYENNILGEVVGVPDRKINSYDIIPSEIRNEMNARMEAKNKARVAKGKAPLVFGKAMQQQVVAPYGIGVKKVEAPKNETTKQDLDNAGIKEGMTTSEVKPNTKFQKKAKKGQDLVDLYGKTSKGEMGSKMTKDSEGNYLFFHYRGEGFKGKNVDPKYFGKNNYTTDRRMHKVSMFYTNPVDKEAVVGTSGKPPVVVRISKDKVYPLQSDPLNYLDKAEVLFRKDFGEDAAFDAHWQASYVGKIAKDNGFEILVSDWDAPVETENPVRAESQIPLKFEEGVPEDAVQAKTGEFYAPMEVDEDIPVDTEQEISAWAKKKYEGEYNPFGQIMSWGTKNFFDNNPELLDIKS